MLDICHLRTAQNEALDEGAASYMDSLEIWAGQIIYTLISPE